MNPGIYKHKQHLESKYVVQKKLLVGLGVLAAGTIAGTAGVMADVMGRSVLDNAGDRFWSYETYLSLFYLLPGLIGIAASLALGGLLLRWLKRPRIIMTALATIALAVILGWTIATHSPLTPYIDNPNLASNWWLWHYLPYIPTIIVGLATAPLISFGLARLKGRRSILMARVSITLLCLAIGGYFAVMGTQMVSLVQKIQTDHNFTVYDITNVPPGLKLTSRGWQESQPGSQFSPVSYLGYQFANASKNTDLTIREFDLTKTNYGQSPCGPASSLDGAASEPIKCVLLGTTPSGRQVYGSYFADYPSYVEWAWVTLGNTRIIIIPHVWGPDSWMAGPDQVLTVAEGLKEILHDRITEFGGDPR